MCTFQTQAKQFEKKKGEEKNPLTSVRSAHCLVRPSVLSCAGPAGVFIFGYFYRNANPKLGDALETFPVFSIFTSFDRKEVHSCSMLLFLLATVLACASAKDVQGYMIIPNFSCRGVLCPEVAVETLRFLLDLSRPFEHEKSRFNTLLGPSDPRRMHFNVVRCVIVF